MLCTLNTNVVVFVKFQSTGGLRIFLVQHNEMRQTITHASDVINGGIHKEGLMVMIWLIRDHIQHAL